MIARAVGLIACGLGLWPVSAFGQTAVPGCHDGRLTDPRAYFYSLIHRSPGEPAADYVGVLSQSGLTQGPGVGVRADEAHFGITQQIAADGPRGVLFLPTDLPDENGYYTRQILVVEANQWTWIDRFPSRPPYAPRECSPVQPTPLPPAADHAQLDRIEATLDAVALSLEDHRQVSRSLYDRAIAFFKNPATIATIGGLLAGFFIPGGNK